MFFFDFALVTIVGAALVAAGIAAAAFGAHFMRKREASSADCREDTLILHGEGARNCN